MKRDILLHFKINMHGKVQVIVKVIITEVCFTTRVRCAAELFSKTSSLKKINSLVKYINEKIV